MTFSAHQRLVVTCAGIEIEVGKFSARIKVGDDVVLLDRKFGLLGRKADRRRVLAAMEAAGLAFEELFD
jgi:hypothetical protein